MHPEQLAAPARPAPPPHREVAGVVVSAMVAAMAAATALAAPATAAVPAPVAASSTTTPTPLLNCVTTKGDGTFRAVFGYVNPSAGTTIPKGAGNRVTPAFLDGIQTTTFRPGRDDAAFATPFVSKDYTVTWTVHGTSVTAGWREKPCAPDVTLPTEGNGIGPILVLLLSMLFSFMLTALHKWRQRKRSA